MKYVSIHQSLFELWKIFFFFAFADWIKPDTVM